ncbi:hypothetical protein GCM10022223_23390 [Kineosporia mesophila]|uniref:Uncharacterized protein n=1 Tax=Kineosporia mesophila TaxID=566012 RepID=A0ABP6ZEL0_9ACTN|nr:hypothetical protein [Kineosporia mesophila]MCD5354173.1 hypothetical protein [Kineosporia mesophila]
MSVKGISLAVAAAALAAGTLTAFGLPAHAASQNNQPGSGPITAAQATYPAIPAKATDKLGFAQDGLEFGYITKARLKNGKLKITVRQAEYYDGKASKLLNGGITPPDDYTIAVDKTLDPFTYTVSGKASLIGVNELRGYPDPVGRKSITAAQLVRNFNRLDTKKVAVWLRHTDTETNSGAVTALAEQFIP